MNMNNKCFCIIVAFFGLMVVHQAFAGFYYSHPFPNETQIAELNMKCVPGRTVIRVTQPPVVTLKDESSEEDLRRYHMNDAAKDELCQVCVCSVDGMNEYCSKRPAMSVNECIRISKLAEELQNNPKFRQSSVLSYMIRRAQYDNRKCVPYVSEYTDCTEDNLCSGCNRCTCTGDAEWSCTTVKDCKDEPTITDQALDNALEVLYTELKNKKKRKPVLKPNDDLVLGYVIAI